MTFTGQLLRQVRNDSFDAAVIFWRNALIKRGYLCDSDDPSLIVTLGRRANVFVTCTAPGRLEAITNKSGGRRPPLRIFPILWTKMLVVTMSRGLVFDRAAVRFGGWIG